MTTRPEDPARRPRRGRWAGSRGAVSAAALGLVVLGGAYWTLIERRPAFPRRQADFPPPPRIEAALAAAEARLKENPQDVAALVQLGVLHFEKGKGSYAEAINELEEARDLGALDARIFYCLGVMYQETGLYPFAAEEYRRFLRNHPDDKETRLLLAKLLFQQGKFPEAVEQYERLKFHFPKDPVVEENLGLSLLGCKRPERAVESFTALKAYGGDEARRAELYLGEISFEQGRYEEALRGLLASLPAEGSAGIGVPLEKIYAPLAMTYQKLDKLDESAEVWEKVLTLVPKDPKAQAALKRLKRRAPSKRKKSARAP